jgi:hypothetical protein
MERITWKNETRKLSDLKPWDKNPMIMTDAKFEKLVGQINDFGFTNPFVINVDNTIVCGHSRRKALIQLGRNEEVVPVRVPSRLLSEEEFTLIALGDNRYVSAFDPGMLGSNFNPDTLLKVGFGDFEFRIPGLPGNELQQGTVIPAFQPEIPGAGSATFQPSTNPEIKNNAVTTEQVNTSQNTLQQQFTSTDPEYFDVICPKCLEEFKVKRNDTTKG